MIRSELTKYSLVVMTYERPAALRRCLESLARLDGRSAPFEVIVVDDGSIADNEAIVLELAGSLRVRYQRIEHAGVAVARNAGLALATGELVAFLADDYTLPRDYLLRACDFFRSYPEASVLTFNVRSCGRGPGRHVQQLYCELVLLENARAEPDAAGVIRTFSLPASRAAIFRRTVLAEVGGFDESLRAGEDGEMGRRLAGRGIPVHFLPKFYIDHWEEKSFAQFLRQRRDYASSFYVLWRKNLPAGPVPRRFTLRSSAHTVRTRLRTWAALSRRTGRLTRFIALAPGLALFLGRFYLTLYSRNRADLRAGRQPAS